LLPFHWTTEDGEKLFPLTVRVNAGPPVAAEEGESEVMVEIVLRSSANSGNGVSVTTPNVQTKILTFIKNDLQQATTF
jgi:hypothetical protein